MYLFVQDGQSNETDKSSGVRVIDIGSKPNSRIVRVTLSAWHMLQAVQKARPKVAHFHDPELILVGLLLKLRGIKVIYDVHEDVPLQILTKYYLPVILRKPSAWFMGAMEWLAGKSFDAIVPATPKIATRFPKKKTFVVQNFPILEELTVSEAVPYVLRPPHFAYVGGLTCQRGAREMVDAFGLVPTKEARLCLAGTFMPQALQSEIEVLPGWVKTNFLGWADRGQVAALLASVRAGLVLLHPTERYPDAYPVKMFEYMAASLPVIASDFPLWRQIVDGAGCGLLVDPLDPKAIAGAIQWLLDNPHEAEAMGRRGRQAVATEYNWDRETRKLVALYNRMLDGQECKSMYGR